jgi:hypothetical protein
MPPKLTLPLGFIALFTGARLNLGYHIALRLLRCGACVIATTRYARDAVARYLKEDDSVIWKERRKVVGADFRSAADAFALVHETKSCLAEWAGGRAAKLDALINNAAQTSIDSVKKEERAVRQEEKLSHEMKQTGLLIEGAYKARIRGGTWPLALGNADVGMNAPHDPPWELNATDAGDVTSIASDTERTLHEIVLGTIALRDPIRGRHVCPRRKFLRPSDTNSRTLTNDGLQQINIFLNIHQTTRLHYQRFITRRHLR